MTDYEDQSAVLHTLRVLLKSHQAILNALKQDMRTYGLSENEFMVLEFLYHRGPKAIQLIKGHLGIPDSSLTYVIDGLSEKALVKRKRCDKDRRKIYINLESAGRQLMDEIFPKHKAFVENLFSVLSKKELIQIDQLNKSLGFHAEALLREER